MGKFFETIPEHLMQWIPEQQMFWVATSPLAASGHVNVSPKGGLYFGLLDDKTFWYMDLCGSGIETVAHLYEPDNGRITIMFCAFKGPPRIVRLFGHGTVLERGAPAFDDFVKKHDVEVIPSSRSIIIVKVHQVASSCGYSVPFYEFKNFRTTLNEHFAKKEERFEQGRLEESKERYWAFKNAYSVDGLPGMQIGNRTGKEEHIAPIEKMVGPMAPRAYRNDRRFNVWPLILVAVLSAVCTALSLPLLLTVLQRPLATPAS
ncbi:hypothetical protein C8A01DRAFT_15530 [Parachaetomium inaequale]|uniref:Pyridoxamine 5'-phosphate oxidase N-terminal domain-containing protein n=1 Tax=Parachaetomium inaequale TaxID=2588326 RepID=A0AAN6PHA7_9PEZI|nr:hypothetical protein C8A01DRAFT_15530 [Parachaetomium inaequale]